MICALCKEPIDRPAIAYREIRGWTKPRTEGGANAIALRRETGKLAHPGCIEVEKVAVNPGQLTLA